MQENPQYDEIELIEQLISGCEQSFEKIYIHYSKRLYGNLFKLVKSDKDAQEILQEVFMKLWKTRQNLNTEKSFQSYLFKIAENKVYDFFRQAARDKKRATHLIAVATTGYVHIEEMILHKENATLLEKAIGSLPPQRQQIFRLCKLEDKSYKEVGELLGISVSTISDHIVKATKAIKAYFINNEQALLSLFAIAFWASS